MSENTIYQQPVQTTPVYAPLPPQYSSARSALPLLTILKLLIGLIIVVGLGALVFVFILPMLTGGRSEKVTLSYWGLWEDSRVMQPIIDDFQRQNPNITINYSRQDIKQYREKLSERINNGTGPDIFRFHNSWYPMFSNILLPLSDSVITKEDFKKFYYPVTQRDLVKNGAIYGIPLSIDTLSLYINNDIFKNAGLNPPSTWNNFMDTAATLTVKEPETGKIKTAGAAIGTFNNVNHAPDIMSLLFLQNGVDPYKMDAKANNVKGALEFYTAFAKDTGSVWDKSLDNSLNFFAGGNVAMYFGYSWDYFTIKAMNPNLNFSVAPVPQLPGRKITLASYWAEGVSRKSKHQKETLRFMNFLAKKETAEKLYSEEAKTRLFGELYARVDLADKLKDTPVDVVVRQAPDASSSYLVASTFDNGLNSGSNTYLGKAVDSMLNNASPETAVKDFLSGITQVLAKYGQK